MILYTIRYVRNGIKKIKERYRLVEHPNVLAIDLMSEAETQIEEKAASRLVYLTVL